MGGVVRNKKAGEWFPADWFGLVGVLLLFWYDVDFAAAMWAADHGRGLLLE